MKNLYQGVSKTWPFSGPFACEPEKIWVLTSPSTVQELSKNNTQQHLLDIDIQDLVSMEYLQLESKLVFITKNSIISYSTETQTCINEGEMACDIIEARWSPSQDFLVLILSNGGVFLQNPELEVLKTQKLSDGVEKVSVAWRTDSKFFQVCWQSEKGFLVSTFDASGEVVKASVVSDNAAVKSVTDRGDILGSELIAWHMSQIAGKNGKNVIFWEKNGLKHEEFEVFGNEIRGLKWNNDGRLLGVATDKGLEVYAKFNYKWYFKYYFPAVQDFQWVEEDLVYYSEKLVRTRLYFSFTESDGKVAVVDGKSVYITEFSQGVVPPPLSHVVYTTDEPVVFVSFNEDKVLVVTSRVVEFPSGNTLLNKQVEKIAQVSNVLYYSISNTLFKQDEVYFEYPSHIISLKALQNNLFVQTSDGSIFKNQELIQKNPVPAEEFWVLNTNEKPIIFTLSLGTLYFSGRSFATNCTSLYFSNSFLFFIRKNAPFDTLYVFQNNDLPWTKPLPDPSKDHFYSRNVEKTSQIVSLFSCNLVLEHSRGNLETISPRQLILSYAKQLIFSKEYLQSFKLLRQHKIDLNLLYDIDKDNFDVKLFVSQVRQQDFINLFLASLKDSDLGSKYYYKETEKTSGKVNILCDKIREHLDPKTHILSILTSFVVKNPPEIETALKWVQQLGPVKNSPKPPHESQSHSSSAADDAVKYLSWLVNPDNLYNVALNMYDLQLASSLAKYTQKDPKEYLPYLNNLNSLPDIEKRFQICMDLKNYEKALEELVQGGEACRAKAISLITDQKMYLKGLELFQGADVWTAIAEALSLTEFSFESAALFSLCGNHERAQELYTKSEEWDLACKCSDILKQDKREIWSAKCAELGRFESAAKLVNSADHELTKIKYLVQGGKYKDAVTFACSEEAKDLVKQTLKHFGEDFIETLANNLKVFNEKKARLDYVQNNKKLMPREEKKMNDETASEYSLNSVSSKMTQVSKKQRKNNRKIRKTAAKEGSVFEEDYLVDLLVSLRPDSAYFEKMEKICEGLIACGDFLTARMVWKKFDELKKVSFQNLETIGQSEFLKKFYESFQEIQKSEENDARLKDMYSKSHFLAEGLASHKLPYFQSSGVSRFFNNFR